MATVSPQNSGLRLVARYLVLALVAVVFLFPLVFMVVSSFKPDSQLLADTGSLRAFLPVGDISLGNYFAAFQRAPVGLFMLNSVFVTGGDGVPCRSLICSLAAFSFVFSTGPGGTLCCRSSSRR